MRALVLLILVAAFAGWIGWHLRAQRPRLGWGLLGIAAAAAILAAGGFFGWF